MYGAPGIWLSRRPVWGFQSHAPVPALYLDVGFELGQQDFCIQPSLALAPTSYIFKVSKLRLEIK